MRFVDNDRWAGAFTPPDNARYLYTIEAMADAFRSWLGRPGQARGGGQDVASALKEGVALVRAAAGRATAEDAAALTAWVGRIEKSPAQPAAVALAQDPALAALMDSAPRPRRRHLERARVRAGRGPASAPASPPGTSSSRARAWPAERTRHVRRRRGALERAAAMGFDVLYLPPIHPIGRALRKGRTTR